MPKIDGIELKAKKEHMIQYTYTVSGRKLSQQLVEDGRIGKNTRYVGQFVLNDGALAWVNIPHGRIFLEKLAIPTLEFHLKDHLGNTRIALTKREGSDYTITQDVSYYPFGMTIEDLSYFGGIGGGSTANRYLYNGKELQDDFTMTSLDWYDYGARFYDAQIGRWHVVDPLAEKYYSISLYAYCANNPIRFIDPDGMQVEVADEQAKKNISHTLTKREAKYVRYDKKGVLDAKRLNKSRSKSENMIALKALANGETVYSFSTASEFTSVSENGSEQVKLVGDNDNGTKGVTLMPGASMDASPDNKVHIITSNNLSDEKQVSNTAHEGYGHAYFYELQQQGIDVNPNHVYEAVILGTDWDEEFNVIVPIIGRKETNTKLGDQIKTVENQAIKNHRSRKK